MINMMMILTVYICVSIYFPLLQQYTCLLTFSFTFLYFRLCTIVYSSFSLFSLGTINQVRWAKSVN